MVIYKKIPRFIKRQFRKLEYNLSHAISGSWFDSVRCRQITGKRMNWRNPEGITQKLLWLNRFWQPQMKVDCADKYRSKLYLENIGLNELVVPLLGVWKTPEEIDFDKLPKQFVLKTNHGCGTNIICFDKDDLDIKATRDKLRAWMDIDYGRLYNERHYSKIQKCIIAEELLHTGAFPVDYKIHCLNGEPYCFLFYPKHTETTCERISFSLDWQRRYYIKGEEKFHYNIPCPDNLAKMLEYARTLSKPFPYVRIDFYESDGRLYLGEFTFTPFSNIMDYVYKPEVCQEMGERLVLPLTTEK